MSSITTDCSFPCITQVRNRNQTLIGVLDNHSSFCFRHQYAYAYAVQTGLALNFGHRAPLMCPSVYMGRATVVGLQTSQVLVQVTRVLREAVYLLLTYYEQTGIYRVQVILLTLSAF